MTKTTVPPPDRSGPWLSRSSRLPDLSSLSTPLLPAGVLWDMDGTLVDSEPYWIAAEHELVGSFGRQWSDELAHELVGNSLLVSGQIIAARSGIPLTPEDIAQRLLDRVTERMREHLPWRPGALELLTELGELGVPSALVTASWRQLVDAFLAGAPKGAFTAIVTGDSVTHGKPDPESYRTAAELLGVAPSACVALEDSAPGVRSATGAGVPTIGVRHLVDLPALPGLVVVESLAGIGAYDLIPIVRSDLGGLIVRLAGVDEVADLSAQVWEAYREVFADPKPYAQWLETEYLRHSARPGHRLVVAERRPSVAAELSVPPVDSGGSVVGFAWGSLGDRGQYWSDLVAADMPEVAREWIGGHFEVVELGVVPQARGLGLGARVFDTLLDGISGRALLETHDDPTSPAMRLYTSRGWQPLGVREPGRQVLGIHLP